MYYTVYKTTNLINGKIYVGVHRTKNLDDGYLGSGLLLNRTIEKYGKENFSKDIIAICDTEEEMYKLEESLVCNAFLTFFSTYNLKLGGEGKFPKMPKEKLSLGGKVANIKLQEYYKRNPDKDFERRSKAQRVRHENGNSPCNFLGKKHTPLTKRLMSLVHNGKHVGIRNSQYGSFWITNGSLNKKCKGNIPEGWYKGRVTKPL